jgi:hypothetical protein
MNKLIRYFAFFISLTLLLACEKEIAYRPNNQIPFLVMNGYLNPDSAWNIGVSQSIPMGKKLASDKVSDAVVKVFVKDIPIETLQYSEVNKRYIGTGKPLAGKEYKITIEKNGFLPIEATSVIEPSPKVLNVSIVKDSLIKDRAFVTVTFSDQSGVKNFYRLVVANEDEYEKRPPWAINSPNSPASGWVGNTYIDYSLGIRSNDPNLTWNNQSSSAGVFDDVPNNIFNIFNDELIDGKTHSLTFSYSLSPYPEAKNNTVIYLQSITKELYMYLKSLSAQYYFGDDPLLEPIQVYSNVKNGGGILGGYNASKSSISVDDLVSK